MRLGTERSRTVAPRPARAFGRPGGGSRCRRGQQLNVVLRPLLFALLQPPCEPGIGWPDGRLSWHPKNPGLTPSILQLFLALTSCLSPSSFGVLSRTVFTDRCDDVGEFPHIFFPRADGSRRRASGTHSRARRTPRVRSGRPSAHRDPGAPHPPVTGRSS